MQPQNANQHQQTVSYENVTKQQQTVQPQNVNQRQQAVPYKNVAQLLTEKALAIHQKAANQAIWKGRPVATDGPMYT